MINPVTKEITETNNSGLTSISDSLNAMAGEGVNNPVSQNNESPLYKFLFFLGAATILSAGLVKLLLPSKPKEIKMEEHKGYPNELLLKDGKIRVSLTQYSDFEIYVNGGLARTLYFSGKSEMPDEEEIYKSLREVGIEPELV
jgi:hypothetical protein